MKKILLSLFVGLIGLINFGYCETVEDLLDVEIHTIKNISLPNSSQFNVIVDFGDINDDTICVKFYNFSHTVDLKIGAFNSTNTSTISRNQWYYYWAGWEGNYTCFYSGPVFHYLVADTDYNSNITFDLDYFFMNNFLSTNIPVMTSIQCQEEYNLIPISSVDQNYCVNNGFCPSSECPDNPGDYTGDLIYSNIYINNILHPGRQNIFINIPDYITWDYSQNEVDFNVYVGSGYDVDYINSIVDINSYRPTSEDFTNVFVSGLTLVFPYIFVALLILFIWKLVKRIFK